MKFETYTPTTWLYWAALLVITFVADSFAAIAVAFTAFTLSLVWQVVQMIIIHRQRKALQPK